MEIAKENAKKNGVYERALFECRDALTPSSEEKIFALLSNPPYVTFEEYETLLPEIYFEPKIAFVAKNNGLYFYEEITKIYKKSIKEDGFIAYEIGKDQAAALKEIAETSSMSIEIIKDYSGNDRVAVLRRKK